MKTIEEKAKAYDEIIERAKTMLAAGEVMYGKENNASQLITDLIPDLKESEDERIRKELIRLAKLELTLVPSRMSPEFWESAIAWLEKQKEQNPAWSEEDEKMLNGIIGRGCSQIPYTEPGLRGEQIDWLKNKLKFLRPKPHWKPSEEQISTLERICSNLHLRASDDAPKLDEIIKLLKRK